MCTLMCSASVMTCMMSGGFGSPLLWWQRERLLWSHLVRSQRCSWLLMPEVPIMLYS